MVEPPESVEHATKPQSPPGAGQQPGQVLADRYELRSVLGQGGMATVWRAHDQVLDRDVAIKLFQHGGAMPDSAARATSEVRMLAGLKHPNLVAVYDAAGSTPQHFDLLVMELVDGTSLRQRLDEGALSPDRTAALGAELAAGLDYVHQRGIVHRDLKPANILLEPTADGDHAKIADFGVARLLEGAALTVAGHTVGTANYLSPEQATGAPVGPASDIYSLGLMLLECLTGTVAYPGHGVAAAAARLHRMPDIPPTLPSDWRSLLHAMTARDPSGRPSAAVVRSRLHRMTTVADAPTVALPSAAADAGTAVMSQAAPAAVGTAFLPSSDLAGGTAAFGVEKRRRRLGLLVAIGTVVAALLVVGVALGLGAGSGGPNPAGDQRSTAPASSSVGQSAAAQPSTAASTADAVVPQTLAAQQSSANHGTGAGQGNKQPKPPGGGPAGGGGPGGPGKKP